MCTITFLPYKNGYILTQNRDESPLRADAVFPVEEEIKNQKVIYPQDPEGSGSWFVSTEAGLTLCVMNGAYHPHKRAGQYAHSRGLVPLHFLAFADADDFMNNYAYQKLEAFTLLVCSPTGVEEFIWDETDMNRKTHRAKPLIFQSDPLYNAEQKAFRKSLFTQFMVENDAITILDFHTQPQTPDNAVNILMDRERVKSVSTIQRYFYGGINEVGYLKLGAEGLHCVSF